MQKLYCVLHLVIVKKSKISVLAATDPPIACQPLQRAASCDGNVPGSFGSSRVACAQNNILALLSQAVVELPSPLTQPMLMICRKEPFSRTGARTQSNIASGRQLEPLGRLIRYQPTASTPNSLNLSH